MVPLLIAVQIEAEESGRAEKRVHVLPVGDAGRGGVIAGLVVSPVWVALDGLLPNDLCILRRNANHPAFGAGLVGTRQECAIAPDDRRGVTGAGQCDFPEQVFGRAPFERDLVVGGVALAGWPAPLRPVAV